MADDAAPLNIQIAGDDAAFLRRSVNEGQFESEQAAVEAALVLLKAERDAYAARLKAALERRMREVRESIDRGEGYTVDEVRAHFEAKWEARRRAETGR